MALKVFAGLVLLAIELVLVFVAQLYSSLPFWVLAYLSLLVVPYVALRVADPRKRLAFLLLISFFINRNFFMMASDAGSAVSLIAWGLLLVALNVGVLFLISAIIAQFGPRPATAEPTRD